MTPNADERPAKTVDKTQSVPSVDDQLMDPRDVVYKAGETVTKNPKEIVENPAVTPQMLNEPGDLRIDVQEED